MISLPKYKQTDPRWSGNRLGTQGRTIGTHGCTCTDVANALYNYGIEETPATVVKKLTAAGGILPSGDLVWSFIEKVWPNVTFYWRQYTMLEGPMYANRQTVDAAIARIRRLIALGQPVLINVDSIGNDRVTDHWVTGFDRDTDGEIIVHCPFRGDVTRFSAHLGSMKNGIYGYAVLIGAPRAIPDWSAEGAEAAALFKAAQIWRGKNVATYAKEIVDTLL